VIAITLLCPVFKFNRIAKDIGLGAKSCFLNPSLYYPLHNIAIIVPIYGN